jgi:hypothetical protein
MVVLKGAGSKAAFAAGHGFNPAATRWVMACKVLFFPCEACNIHQDIFNKTHELRCVMHAGAQGSKPLLRPTAVGRVIVNFPGEFWVIPQTIGSETVVGGSR